jgi:ubiquitin C-terminal hydrolase
MTTADGVLCKPCSKVMGKRSIRRHAEEMHINVGIAYQCPLCKIVKNTKNAIKLHVGRKHPKLKGIDINRCQFTGYSGGPINL